MYQLNFANETCADFQVNASGGDHEGNFNIEHCPDGSIEIYLCGGTYRNRDNYDTSSDVTAKINPDDAPDFIATLQAWIEQL